MYLTSVLEVALGFQFVSVRSALASLRLPTNLLHSIKCDSDLIQHEAAENCIDPQLISYNPLNSLQVAITFGSYHQKWI